MKKQMKGIFVGLISATLLVGCAEKEGNEPIAEQVAMEVKTTLEQVEPSHFVYAIVNASDKATTYTFPSGMQMDYTLYKDGKKLYTQSDVVSFTQAVTKQTIEPKSTQQYDIHLEQLEPGAYELHVWSTAKEFVDETKQTLVFQVE